MIQGDHLQVLYHFWLGGDMLRGETPPFRNVYEFNQGDDDARKQFRSYFFPFSAVFLLGDTLAGHAAGINLAVFVSIWLSLFFAWGLSRCYIQQAGWSFTAAFLSLLLAYRWSLLLGGSPGGYAATWLPATWWAVHRFVERRTLHGSFALGLTLLLTASGDIQVFYFSLLSLPPLAMFSLLALAPASLKGWFRSRTLLLFASPGLLGGLALLYTLHLTRNLGKSTMGAGRHFEETNLYSPLIEGLWTHAKMGITNDIYLGFAIPLILLLCLVALAITWLRRQPESGRRLLLFILLLLALIGVFAVALGTQGPWQALPLRAARALLPHFSMIRQPTKILCLASPMLTIATALGFTAIQQISANHAKREMLWPVLLILAFMDTRNHIQTTVCLLDRQQNAYAAVRQDADERGIQPHAVVIPLWPGDSSWASLYLDYASLYRIRMLNGYSPVIPQTYLNIFKQYSSLNQGFLENRQIESLQAMGIDYLLFHEDAFPDKVSPYPAGTTLQSLLNHPNLTFLERDGPVWAFRIGAEPRRSPPSHASATDNWYFPSRVLFIRSAAQQAGLSPKNAEPGSPVRLMETGIPFDVKSNFLTPHPKQRAMIRVRGQGQLSVRAQGHEDIWHLDSEAWVWKTLPLEILAYEQSVLTFELLKGIVEIDQGLITAGRSLDLDPGADLELPAAAFFRAGFSNPNDGTVSLRMRSEASGIIFYGPHLPLEPGTYRVVLHVESPAPDGTHLGDFSLAGSSTMPPILVTSGQPAQAEWKQIENIPIRFQFRYSRDADMVIQSVHLFRLP